MESWRAEIPRQVTASRGLFTGARLESRRPPRPRNHVSSNESFVELDRFCAVPDDGITGLVSLNEVLGCSVFCAVPDDGLAD